nr:TetR family transcriptional regulator [Caldovatus aquaticus]
MRNRSETRARIRRQALALFVARGVEAVSVRDIAAAAGRTPSNLCAHRPSLGALIGALFAEGRAAYGRGLDAMADEIVALCLRLDAREAEACRR